jgi:polyhydroxyalkanoate synthesis regulator phasin
MSQEEGRQFVDEMIKKSESVKDQLNLWVNQRVEERIRALNLATSDEVADLRRKVEELQVAINREPEA